MSDATTSSPSAAWLLAARPQTLPAAAAPVIVAAALAAADGVFRWDRFTVTLLAAVAIQVGVNFANDLADAQRGADTADRIGPTRAVASGLIAPSQMRTGIAVAFGIATILGAYLVAVAGWVIAVIGVASVVAALGYTGGPAPYGYRGLGELFVFVFFGLVATVGARYVYDRTGPTDAWIAGVAMGALATAILVANNLRDIDTDRAAHKRTLAVRLGRGRTRVLYAGLLAAAYATVAAGVVVGSLPPATLSVLLTAPLAVGLARTASTTDAGPPLIGVLVGTARLQLLFAMVLTAAVLAAG